MSKSESLVYTIPLAHANQRKTLYHLVILKMSYFSHLMWLDVLATMKTFGEYKRRTIPLNIWDISLPKGSSLNKTYLTKFQFQFTDDLQIFRSHCQKVYLAIYHPNYTYLVRSVIRHVLTKFKINRFNTFQDKLEKPEIGQTHTHARVHTYTHAQTRTYFHIYRSTGLFGTQGHSTMGYPWVSLLTHPSSVSMRFTLYSVIYSPSS